MQRAVFISRKLKPMSTSKEAIKELLDAYNRLTEVLLELVQKNTLATDLQPMLDNVREMRTTLEETYWGPPSAVDRPVAYSQT